MPTRSAQNAILFTTLLDFFFRPFNFNYYRALRRGVVKFFRLANSNEAIADAGDIPGRGLARIQHSQNELFG